MIKKVALFAVASILSFGIAATTFAEEHSHEVKCVGGEFDASKKAGDTNDGKPYTLEANAAACTSEARKGTVVAE